MVSRMVSLVLAGSALVVAAQGARMPRVHDPSTIVSEGGESWCFATGHGISVLRQDGREWLFAGTVFPRGRDPQWHRDMVPGNKGHLWAPDVIELGGRWCVYYSVSTFGKNTSAIGMASRRKPGPGTEDEPWEDHGVIVSSGSGDRFNAIDPAVVRDGRKLWMSFGSYWDGIMLIELDPVTGLRRDAGRKPVRLAAAPDIEAPFLHTEGGWHYLFVNWGKCCRGTESTYEIRVGRSRRIDGPYEDRAGNPMVAAGGTLVLGSRGRFIGPGHASIYRKGGRQWLVHHFYDGDDRGVSKLRLLPLEWEDGWPVVRE